MSIKAYFCPDENIYFSIDKLSTQTENVKYKTMEYWFYERYEDPANSCPHESREGGYSWIHGGPFEADEMLMSEFEDSIDNNLISKLAKVLNNECHEWSGKMNDEADFFEWLSPEESPYDIFNEAINSLNQLAQVHLTDEQSQILYKMIFVNLVTCLESYLSDFFSQQLDLNENNKRCFVEKNKDFISEKFSLSQIFNKYESLDKFLKEYLLKIQWHNLPKIKKLFSFTLQIDFGNIENLMVSISKRHDLVHRNGKIKNKDSIHISKKDIDDFLNLIKIFVDSIEKKSLKNQTA